MIVTLSTAILGLVAAPAAKGADAVRLPPRTLMCTLGRIANFDPTKEQAPADFVFEGSHAFSLFLPSIPARTTPPPESTAAPEPVDPRTRVIADPDGLTKGVPAKFDRVVDYWPDRVEMTTTIDFPSVNLIIVDQIDAARGVANLFMTKATDAVTYDFDKMYAGRCSILS